MKIQMQKFIKLHHQRLLNLECLHYLRNLLMDYVEFTDEIQDIYINVDEISSFQDHEIRLKNGDVFDYLVEDGSEIMEKIQKQIL